MSKIRNDLFSNIYTSSDSLRPLTTPSPRRIPMKYIKKTNRSSFIKYSFLIVQDIEMFLKRSRFAQIVRFLINIYMTLSFNNVHFLAKPC